MKYLAQSKTNSLLKSPLTTVDVVCLVVLTEFILALLSLPLLFLLLLLLLLVVVVVVLNPAAPSVGGAAVANMVVSIGYENNGVCCVSYLSNDYLSFYAIC